MKKIVLYALVLVVALAGAALFIYAKDSLTFDPKLTDEDMNAWPILLKYNPANFGMEKEGMSDEEQKKVADYVVDKLNSKYGKQGKFLVKKVLKGTIQAIDQPEYDINRAYVYSRFLNKRFIVDLINNSDDFLGAIADRLGVELKSELGDENVSNVTVLCKKFSNHDLNEIYGHIPTLDDLKDQVHSIDMNYAGEFMWVFEEDTYDFDELSPEVKTFLETQIPHMMEKYALLNDAPILSQLGRLSINFENGTLYVLEERLIFEPNEAKIHPNKELLTEFDYKEFMSRL